MVKDNKLFQTETYTKVNINRVNLMEKEDINGSKVDIMKGNFIKEWEKEKVDGSNQIKLFMKVHVFIW